MVRQLMYVVQHGRTRKVWIDPKDIYTKSDVPFVPGVFPTKADNSIERAKKLEEDYQIEHHADWNTPDEEPIKVVEKISVPMVELPVKSVKKSGRRKK